MEDSATNRHALQQIEQGVKITIACMAARRSSSPPIRGGAALGWWL